MLRGGTSHAPKVSCTRQSAECYRASTHHFRIWDWKSLASKLDSRFSKHCILRRCCCSKRLLRVRPRSAQYPSHWLISLTAESQTSRHKAMQSLSPRPKVPSVSFKRLRRSDRPDKPELTNSDFDSICILLRTPWGQRNAIKEATSWTYFSNVKCHDCQGA
jgi:hypothetical protein